MPRRRHALYAHKMSQRCVRCGLHAACRASAQSQGNTFQEERQQRSPVYPSSPDRDNPNGHPILSSRHRRLGQSDQGKSSQSASPNADTATPFPAPTSHDSPLRILHRRILGIFPLTFTSSRVTFAMYPPAHAAALLTTTVTVTNVPAFMHALAGDD